MKLSNGISVHQYGNKNSIPVIFIHGFPFDSRMWINQVKALENDYHCIVYDVRGLGESDPGDGQYTMEMFADDLFEVMHELNLDRPVVGGISMGGYIALRAIEREPSKFRGLVLFDTKTEEDTKEGKLKRAAGVKRINLEGTKGYITDLMPGCFSDLSMTELSDVYEVVLERAFMYNPKGVKGCLLAMAGRTDTSGVLKEIKVPTLLICGSLDKLIHPDQMRKLSEKITGSEFAIAPRAGHMTPLENPEFVNDVLLGFLKRRISGEVK